MAQPVFVTGLGVASPVGVGVDSFWRSQEQGRSGLTLDPAFAAAGVPCAPVVGRIPDADKAALRARREYAGWDWHEVLADVVLRQALEEAGPTVLAQGRIALVFSEAATDPLCEHLATSEPERGRLSRWLATMHDRCSRPFEILSVESVCATGSRVLAEASRLVRDGHADVAIALATSSRLNPYFMGAYAQMGALSTWRGAPHEACRPFDKQRSGMVVAEGAACLIVESAASVEQRQAKVRARVAGWQFVNGGAHPTTPDTALIARAMAGALASAGVSDGEIDAINAHGSSTRLNDLHEAAALKLVFGARLADLGISACKGALGHSWPAASLVESVAAVLCLERQCILPVPTCVELDPACAVPVRREAVSRPVRAVLKNAFGFGGQYSSVVFTRA